MVNVNSDRLLELKENFAGKKIAVIGDMMLDGYYWGAVNRISPEAPVPVLEVEEDYYRFGGAANCALNIFKLGGEPIPIGIIGSDRNGEIFRDLMKEAGIVGRGIQTVDDHPTTTKIRAIADNHHIVRLDHESKAPIDPKTEIKILEFLQANIHTFDALILQDYNKGVLTPKVIGQVINLANEFEKITSVDPKFLNFFEYKDATVFKPNRKETEDALKINIDSREELLFAGKELIEKLNPQNLLMTLGEEGLALFRKSEEPKQVPTRARKVADVSGAGDTVITTLTMALCAGAGIEEAAYLANYAAGIVCEEVGIVPIELEKLFDVVLKVVDG